MTGQKHLKGDFLNFLIHSWLSLPFKAIADETYDSTIAAAYSVISTNQEKTH